jgi:hypothetical protein
MSSSNSRPPARRGPSGAWGRLRQPQIDPLEVYGLPSKGETRSVGSFVHPRCSILIETDKIGRSQDTRDIFRTHSRPLHEILRFPPQRRESRSRFPQPRYRLYFNITHTTTSRLSKSPITSHNPRDTTRNVDHPHGHAKTPRSPRIQPPHRCLCPKSLHLPNPRCNPLQTSRNLSSSTTIPTLQNSSRNTSITTRVARIC